MLVQGPCIRLRSTRHPCTSHFLCIVPIKKIQKKKTDYLSQIMRVSLVQEPCSNIQTVSRRKEKSSVLCGGHSYLLCFSRSAFARNSHLRTSSPGLQRFAPHTMGGLSGGRRGGDLSGAVSAPSLVVARLRARALAFGLACGIRCPPFVIRKAYAIEGSNAPRRKRSAMR